MSNISNKNSSYCELTGLHWIVNNSREDVIGLAHYRRVLGKLPQTGSFEPLNQKDILQLLQHSDCLISRRDYLRQGQQPLTVASHYRILHSSTDLHLTRDALRRVDPHAIPAFDAVMKRSYLFPCNLIICKSSCLRATPNGCLPSWNSSRRSSITSYIETHISKGSLDFLLNDF